MVWVSYQDLIAVIRQNLVAIAQATPEAVQAYPLDVNEEKPGKSTAPGSLTRAFIEIFIGKNLSS